MLLRAKGGGSAVLGVEILSSFSISNQYEK
jgi:hypothetical protein